MNGDMITIYYNGMHMPVLWSHLVPATLEGKALYNVRNAMFATAMAFCFGVDLDNIRHGLRTFDTSFFQAPGRTNIYDELPFKVLLDYAHNPAAFAAIADLADRLEVSGRRILVVAVPGDRRDEDVFGATRILAGHFEHFICKADDNRRGRGDNEIPEMLRGGLMHNGVDGDAITMIGDEVTAIDHALNLAQDGDLLVMFGDNSARCWKQVVHFRDEEHAEAPDRPTIAQPRAVGDFESEGETLIRDERGVRLARAVDEDGD